MAVTFVSAVGIRLINLLFLSGHDAYFSQDDSELYWKLGTALAHASTFGDALFSSTERMPLYPLFLGGVQSLFGDAPQKVACLQAVADSATCVLIAALGGLYSRNVGMVAGALAACWVNLIIFSTQILTDTAFVFFFTGFLYFGARFLRSPAYGMVALAGLSGGLSLAIRPVPAIMLAASVPVVFYSSLLFGRRLAAAVVAAALLITGILLPIAPVLVRNVTHYGSWKLMSETGDHLAYWIVPLVTQRADGSPFQQTVERMRSHYKDRLLELGLDGQSDPFRLDAIKTDIARDAMKSLPASAFLKAWLEGMVVNLAAPAIILDPRVRALPKPRFYDVPGQTLWARGKAYVLEGPGIYSAILLFGIVACAPFLFLQAQGFVILCRLWPWAGVLSGLVLAYFLLINGPVATPKYRLPMEPILIVLSAIAIEWWWRAGAFRCIRLERFEFPVSK